MKKTTIGIVGLGMALGLGLVLAAPNAEAITTKKVAVHAASTSANYTFILGEDGAVWYTVTSTTGTLASTAVKTGNTNNVFETANIKSNGFVATTGTTSLSSQCTSDTCSGIFAKTPGAQGFNDAPSVSIGGPICNFTSSSGGAGTSGETTRVVAATLTSPPNGVLNILVPGLDKEIWYTLYDAAGNLSTTSTMCGTAGTHTPTNGAFATAKENNNTGFVLATGTTSLANSCSDNTATCVGIWAKMP